MNSDKYDILVQSYLGDELSDVDRKSFEKELEINIELQRELKLYQSVEFALKDNSLIKFKVKLDNIHRNFIGNEKRTRMFGFKPFNLLAASIIVLISLGSIIMYTFSSTPTNLDVFNKYYEPYEISLMTRSTYILKDTTIKNAMNSYIDGEYNLAKQQLDDMVISDKNHDQVQFILGVSNLHLNFLEEAQANFKTVIIKKNPFYYQQAEWYLSLTYLKSDDKKNALAQLNSIVLANGFYKVQANEMLSHLE